jgi:hypothetical protein
MSRVQRIGLAIGGLFVIAIGGMVAFAPDSPTLYQRINASCRKEYASTPGLIDQCVISTMTMHVEEAEQAKAQRAYNRSR